MHDAEQTLTPDPRFAGRIKWYVQPVAFGGDPTHEANILWVGHEQHGELVRWWNDLYLTLRPGDV